MQIDKLILSFDNGFAYIVCEQCRCKTSPRCSHRGSTSERLQQTTCGGLNARQPRGRSLRTRRFITVKTFSSPNTNTVAALKHAANEEIDHLAWCEGRIQELGGRKSLLNPLWYAGSFALGAIAGKLDDKWNLGFLAETEHQVSAHLQVSLI